MTIVKKDMSAEILRKTTVLKTVFVIEIQLISMVIFVTMDSTQMDSRDMIRSHTVIHAMPVISVWAVKRPESVLLVIFVSKRQILILQILLIKLILVPWDTIASLDRVRHSGVL